jgi:hypothetical protein
MQLETVTETEKALLAAKERGIYAASTWITLWCLIACWSCGREAA